MQPFQAQIREVIRETADTVTLVLAADVPRDYRAGQFLNVDPHRVEATRDRARQLEEQKGKKERPRAYSLASAPHEPYLAITIKEEPEGLYPSLLSPYFVGQARVGDELPCSGFAGLYTLSDDLPEGAHIIHVCAGSGIVPNYGIIKDALHRGLPYRHTLLYSNRRWDDVIFRRDLGLLAQQHPDRLSVRHTLTREMRPVEGPVCEGRISAPLIREHVPELEAAWFFICGPSIPSHERVAARARGEVPAPRFLECMKQLLAEMGVPKQRVHYEGW